MLQQKTNSSQVVTAKLLATEWNALYTNLTAYQFSCMLAGGIAYTLGAIIYGLERPNPLPKVFGYHEVFHSLVVLAAALHFAAIYDVVVSS